MLRGSQGELERWIAELQSQNKFEPVKHFMPGGTWRNFRVKYPEANLMYGRMLQVSRTVGALPSASRSRAQEELYRAQCNCGYWHGVFGGLYLPHLRHSIYRHLLMAEREAEKDPAPGYKLLDLDLDGREEIRLHNGRINIFLDPDEGGRIVELDERERGVNLTAGLSRRAESYHERVKKAVVASEGETRSIHDLVLTKVEGIGRHLRYDRYTRATLLDHFYPSTVRVEEVEAGEQESGDFIEGAYRSAVSRKGKSVTAVLTREGCVRLSGGEPLPVLVRKEITLADEPQFQVEYSIENRGGRILEGIFAVEFLMGSLGAAMALHRGDKKPMGTLGETKDHPGGPALWISDDWHDMSVGLVASSVAGFWVFPLQTVSISEGGFELNFQAGVVMPHWNLRLEAGRSWKGVITHRIENR